MNNDYLGMYRRKMKSSGLCDKATFYRDELKRNVDDVIDMKLSATVYTVDYVSLENVGLTLKEKEVNVNVTDTSKNDQKSNDEKYFDFKLDSNVKIGDQIFWSGKWWIMYHEELVSNCSYKTFTAKKCNFLFNFDFLGNVYKIPCPMQNLTLYSDGMADKVYMSNQDGSRRITLPNNELINYIKPGIRIMVTKDTVFEVAHIDEFSREGIKECILSQIFITSKDSSEDKIAFNKEYQQVQNSEIKGSDIIFLGGLEVYTTDIVDYSRWEVVSVDNCVKVDTQYDGCRLICSDDNKYINQTITLNLIKYGGVIASKNIKIKGMF